jgi:hypothetical protein
VVYSSKDGHLYIADQAQTGACAPSCIWRVDPATGAIDATPIVVAAQGNIEGLAVDSNADHLYYTDRGGNGAHVSALAWSGTAYSTVTSCTTGQNPKPQTPFHLVIDATIGAIAVDDNGQQLVSVALPCVNTTVGANFTTQGSFNTPRGIAAGVGGNFYVSDNGGGNNGTISQVTSAGVVSAFTSTINNPYGMEWLTGGASAFADSLIVAAGDRTVRSTKGTGTAAAVAYVRTSPIDLTFNAGTMYVVTQAGQNNLRGRLYKVTGF